MQQKDNWRRSAHRVAFFHRVSQGDLELGHSCDMESANQIAKKIESLIRFLVMDAAPKSWCIHD
jgi:hypothetical protein